MSAPIITPVAAGEHITVPTNDGTGYKGQIAEADGLYFQIDDGGFFIPANELRRHLDNLGWGRSGNAELAAADNVHPSPYALWIESKGDRYVYEELLVMHGFLERKLRPIDRTPTVRKSK